MRKRILLPVLALTVLLSGCGGRTENIGDDRNIKEMYRAEFSAYIVDKLDLTKYDRELAESEENYIPNNPDRMNRYQKADKCGLSYIYIRNEIHTDRLGDKDREIAEHVLDGNAERTAVATEFIERTYPKLISFSAITKEADKNLRTYYNSVGMEPQYVTNDTLVLNIGTTAERDDSGSYKDIDREIEKSEELNRFAKRMENELHGKLGDIPIRVFSDASSFALNINIEKISDTVGIEDDAALDTWELLKRLGAENIDDVTLLKNAADFSVKDKSGVLWYVKLNKIDRPKWVKKDGLDNSSVYTE